MCLHCYFSRCWSAMTLQTPSHAHIQGASFVLQNGRDSLPSTEINKACVVPKILRGCNCRCFSMPHAKQLLWLSCSQRPRRFIARISSPSDSQLSERARGWKAHSALLHVQAREAILLLHLGCPGRPVKGVALVGFLELSPRRAV